ncbi:MAG: hypothetical protein IPL39_06575 [Opitutaceae bacterium]|nr:hypothetical protein [Opitutaceae bacterium]
MIRIKDTTLLRRYSLPRKPTAPTDMHTTHRSRTLIRTATIALGLLAAGITFAAEPATLEEALLGGKVSLNLRARYEGVDQTGLKDADAFTLRTRLGYTTAAYQGFKASLEFENIASPDGDAYSQAGLNSSGAGKAVVADPVGSEVNQVWLSYTTGATSLTAGRQRLVLDNARFVGDVGWRQNAQTFDAFVLQNKSVEKLALTYAYLDRVNRVFGHKHAQGAWKSDSHLVNAAYTGLPYGTLTTYVYLLDFDSAAASSCATYGLSFAGTAPVSDALKITYRSEYARQVDYGSSTLDYASDYYAIETGLAHKLGSLALGYEVLGSDHNVGFKTPLATLHAFNGWADLFLNTPASGLRDLYIKAAVSLPGEVKLLAFYHHFEADRGGAGLGSEFDLQLGRKLYKSVTGLVKYAAFDRATTTLPNVQKLWVQVEYAF